MTRTIDFYFDFPSPYSYLAHTQLPRIAAEHGAAVAYHPFRILELMKIVGNRPTTIECRNKSKYAGADLQRWTRRYKVDFARNPYSKTFDFAELDRGALVAIEDGRGAEYVTAVFVAIWQHSAMATQPPWSSLILGHKISYGRCATIPTSWIECWWAGSAPSCLSGTRPRI